MLLSEKPHATPPLKEFTRILLAMRRDLTCIEDGFESTITWESIEADAAAVVQVLSELIRAALHKLSQLKEIDATVQLLCADLELNAAQVSALLATAPFSALSYGSIRVTKGHQGVVPFDHQANVFRALSFSASMTEQEVITLVLASQLHDLGKGLSAGVQNIDELMLEFKSKHSHPNHAWISLFMTNALLQTAAFQEFRDMLRQEWQYFDEYIHELLQLIAYHHGFEDVYVEDGELRAHPGGEADLQALRNLSPELVVLLYYFAFADMCSTVPYRQFWNVKQEFFAAWWAEQHWSSLEPRIVKLAQDALALQPALIPDTQNLRK